MKSAISDALTFLRTNDLKTILSRVRERRVPGLIQFAVYGLCGGLATVFFLGIVIVLSKTVIPAYEGMMVDGQPITDALRAKNLLINNTIAFLVANVVAYVTNILFVFKGGRHHPVLEFLYFTLISGIAFVISQAAGPWLVNRFGVPTNLAILSNVLTSMLLNFMCRKFFVFKS
jgi:putative flippase GtrA